MRTPPPPTPPLNQIMTAHGGVGLFILFIFILYVGGALKNVFDNILFYLFSLLCIFFGGGGA